MAKYLGNLASAAISNLLVHPANSDYLYFNQYGNVQRFKISTATKTNILSDSKLLNLSANGNTLFIKDSAGQIKSYSADNPESLSLVKTFSAPGVSDSESSADSPDRSLIVVRAKDSNKVFIYSSSDASLKSAISVTNPYGYIFSPDSKKIAICEDQSKIKVYDLSDPAQATLSNTITSDCGYSTNENPTSPVNNSYGFFRKGSEIYIFNWENETIIRTLNASSSVSAIYLNYYNSALFAYTGSGWEIYNTSDFSLINTVPQSLLNKNDVAFAKPEGSDLSGYMYGMKDGEIYLFDLRAQITYNWSYGPNGAANLLALPGALTKDLSYINTCYGKSYQLKAEVNWQDQLNAEGSSQKVQVANSKPELRSVSAPEDGLWSAGLISFSGTGYDKDNDFQYFNSSVCPEAQDIKAVVLVKTNNEEMKAPDFINNLETSTINKEYNLSGAYTWVMTFEDEAGESSDPSAERVFNIDASDPLLPGIQDQGDFAKTLSGLNFKLYSKDDNQPISKFDYMLYQADSLTGSKSPVLATWKSIAANNDSADLNINSSDLKPGASFSSGKYYFLSAKSENATGRQSQIASSNGIMTDIALPVKPGAIWQNFSIHDGKFYQSVNSKVNFRLNSSVYDLESGLHRYFYSLGTSSNGIDLKSWGEYSDPNPVVSANGEDGSRTTAISDCSSTTKLNGAFLCNDEFFVKYTLSIPETANYYLALSTSNYSENPSTHPSDVYDKFGIEHEFDVYVTGSSLTVPTAGGLKGTITNPASETAQTGFLHLGEISSGSKRIHINWKNKESSDDYPFASNARIISLKLYKQSENHEEALVTASLADGAEVFLNLKSSDRAENESESFNSASITIDTSAPVFANDLNADIIDLTSLSGSWGAVDDPHSGIKSIEVAYFTTPDPIEQDFITIPVNDDPGQPGNIRTGYTFENLNLLFGSSYYYAVRVTNGAGLSTMKKSAAFKLPLPYPTLIPKKPHDIGWTSQKATPHQVIPMDQGSQVTVSKYQYRVVGEIDRDFKALSDNNRQNTGGVITLLPGGANISIMPGALFLKKSGPNGKGEENFQKISNGSLGLAINTFLGEITGDYDKNTKTSAYLPYQEDFSDLSDWIVATDSGEPNPVRVRQNDSDGEFLKDFIKTASFDKTGTQIEREISYEDRPIEISVDFLFNKNFNAIPLELKDKEGNAGNYVRVEINQGKITCTSNAQPSLTLIDNAFNDVWYRASIKKHNSGYAECWVHPVAGGVESKNARLFTGFPKNWPVKVRIRSELPGFKITRYQEVGAGARAGIIVNGKTDAAGGVEYIDLDNYNSGTQKYNVSHLSPALGKMLPSPQNALVNSVSENNVLIGSDGRYLYAIATAVGSSQFSGLNIKKYERYGEGLLLKHEGSISFSDLNFNLQQGVEIDSVIVDGNYLTMLSNNDSGTVHRVNIFPENDLDSTWNYPTAGYVNGAYDPLSGNYVLVRAYNSSTKLKLHQSGKWIDTPANTAFESTLSKTGEYQVQARAILSNGYITDAAEAFIRIDNSAPRPPSPPSVQELDVDGNPIRKFHAFNDSLSASWSMVQDYQSGIAGYEIAIDSNDCAGSPNLCNWENVGNRTKLQWSSDPANGIASLTDQETYKFYVRAINSAGVYSSASQSFPTIIDQTAPDSVEVKRDGYYTYSNADPRQIHVRWYAADNVDNKFKRYAAIVENEQECEKDTTNYEEWVAWDNSFRAIVPKDPIVMDPADNKDYYICFYAKDTAGNKSQTKNTEGPIRSCAYKDKILINGSLVNKTEFTSLSEAALQGKIFESKNLRWVSAFDSDKWKNDSEGLGPKTTTASGLIGKSGDSLNNMIYLGNLDGTAPRFKNFEFKADFRAGQSGIAGITFKVKDGGNYYLLAAVSDLSKLPPQITQRKEKNYAEGVYLIKVSTNQAGDLRYDILGYNSVLGMQLSSDWSTVNNFKVIFEASRIEAYINGIQAFYANDDSSELSYGGVGLFAPGYGSNQGNFKNVFLKVRLGTGEVKIDRTQANRTYYMLSPDNITLTPGPIAKTDTDLNVVTGTHYLRMKQSASCEIDVGSFEVDECGELVIPTDLKDEFVTVKTDANGENYIYFSPRLADASTSPCITDEDNKFVLRQQSQGSNNRSASLLAAFLGRFKSLEKASKLKELSSAKEIFSRYNEINAFQGEIRNIETLNSLEGIESLKIESGTRKLEYDSNKDQFSALAMPEELGDYTISFYDKFGFLLERKSLKIKAAKPAFEQRIIAESGEVFIPWLGFSKASDVIKNLKVLNENNEPINISEREISWSLASSKSKDSKFHLVLPGKYAEAVLIFNQETLD